MILQLQVEAKSIDHMKNVNKGLENKIIQLQQQLDFKVSITRTGGFTL